MIQAFIDIVLELIISMVMGAIIISIPVVLSKYYRKGMMMKEHCDSINYNVPFYIYIVSEAYQVVMRSNIIINMTSYSMMILPHVVVVLAITTTMVVIAIIIASIKLTEVAEVPLHHRSQGITAISLDENKVAEVPLHHRSQGITASPLDENNICK